MKAAGQTPKNHAASGFTIVETLFVLAIAGIILLIVFMAIPALQRSSRNNQRRQDVQIALQSVSHYELNNSGTVPDTGDLQTFINTYAQNKLTYYAPADITVSIYPATNTVYSIANLDDLDKLLVANRAKCTQPADGTATNLGAGYSDVVALYTIETGGGQSPQCQQL